MPITLDKKLPAVDILRSENIFVMDDIRATHQDIRPIHVKHFQWYFKVFYVIMKSGYFR